MLTQFAICLEKQKDNHTAAYNWGMKSTGLSSEEKKAQTIRKTKGILFLLSMAMIVWIFMLFGLHGNF